MTDYNDGKWHGWNGGGECPVHPKSQVEAVWHDHRRNSAGMTGPRPAKVDNEPTLAWVHVVKFRVVKEYRVPQELTFDPSTYFMWFDSTDGLVHVREVAE